MQGKSLQEESRRGTISHMDTQVEIKRQERRRLRWLRGLFWVLGGLASLLTLAVVAAACWLWSWQWGDTSLKFHESWTADERKALVECDAYLRTDYIQAVMAGVVDGTVPSWGATLIYDFMRKTVVAPVCGQLRDIAESGNACVPGVDTIVGHGVTPAILAAQAGHFSALKALVLHGADPNACIDMGHASVSCETPLTPLLSGSFAVADNPVPWEERREMAEFLLAQGADINAASRLVGLCCTVALMHGDAAPWFWALEKGYKASGEDFCNLMLQEEVSLELMERMLKAHPDLANACYSGKTMVQHLVESCYYDAERMEALEPVLALLLKYGAVPNRLPAGGEEADELETWLPRDYLLEHEPADAPDSREYAAWSRLCEMLKPQT